MLEAGGEIASGLLFGRRSRYRTITGPDILQEAAEEAEMGLQHSHDSLLPLRSPVNCLCDYALAPAIHPTRPLTRERIGHSTFRRLAAVLPRGLQ